MQTCENCGQRFEPSEAQPGCPHCASAVRRARPAGTAKAPASGAPVRTAPSAAPKAAAKPQPGAAKAPTHNAKAPAASAQPRRTAPARIVTSDSEAEVTPRPVAKPAARPAPKRVVEEDEDDAPQLSAAARAMRGGHSDQVLDKSAKIGLIITGALAVIVAIAVMIAVNKRNREEAERKAREAEIRQVYDDLQKLDPHDEIAAARLLAMAESKKSLWMGHELERDIQGKMISAQSAIEAGKERRELEDSFNNVSKQVLDTASLTPEQVRDLRRRLADMELKISPTDAEMLAKLSAVTRSADKAYVERLISDAKAGADGANPREAIVRFQKAEDETRVLLDKAIKEKSDQEAFFKEKYQEAIRESDALITKVFTDAEIEKLPWIDCLVAPQAVQWNPSQVKGFSHAVSGHILTINGPDLDAGRSAVVSIGDREQWRNFVLLMEFTIEKGDIDLFLRLGKAPNSYTLSTELYTSEKASSELTRLTAGKQYTAVVEVIGSQIKMKYLGDGPMPFDNEVQWTKVRKGGIGLVVVPGAQAKFTKFQVKDLR